MAVKLRRRVGEKGGGEKKDEEELEREEIDKLSITFLPPYITRDHHPLEGELAS